MNTIGFRLFTNIGSRDKMANKLDFKILGELVKSDTCKDYQIILNTKNDGEFVTIEYIVKDTADLLKQLQPLVDKIEASFPSLEYNYSINMYFPQGLPQGNW